MKESTEIHAPTTGVYSESDTMHNTVVIWIFFFQTEKTIEIQRVRPSEVKYKVMVKYKVGYMAKCL